MRLLSRLFVPVALVACLVPSAFAQTSPRFTVEEMLKLRRVSDPQLSPDGRQVAYVVTDVSLERSTRINHIWLVPVAGGEPVQVARSEKAEDTPRWSPDGKQLAFVSTRGGSSQIWVVPMGPAGTAGEPKRITNLATEASGVVWSPDGKWIAFTSDVYAECSTVECNEQKLKEFEARKSKARVFDHLMFRHWVSWKEGRFTHIYVTAADGTGTPRDVTPGQADAPPFSLSGPEDFAFSPDSKELAFARKTDPMESISTNSDLFLLDLTDPAAKPRKVTTNPAADGGPAYSPDGRYIAYRAQHKPGFEADRWQLMVYDRKTGEHRSTSVSWDRSADSYAWTSDSKSLFVAAEDQGSVGLFRFELAGGAPKRLPVGGSAGDVHVTADGKTLVFTRSAIHQATEIYRSAADGTGAQPLTNTNPGLAAFKLRPAESLTYEGAGGTKIQGWLIKPADFKDGQKYPLIFIVHGGPQSAFNDAWGYRWNAEVFANAGYVVFMPNPRGSTGFGQQFTDEISGDWAGKVYEDLMKGADYVESLPFIEKGKTGAAGASFGGYMMDWFLGHTDRFKAIVSHAGVYNLTSMYGVTEELWFPEWDLKGTPWTNPDLYARLSPHTYAKNFKTPTLVTHGELDFRVPIGEGLQLFTALQRQGIPSRMVYLPDEGHWINKPANSALWYREFIAWMDKWVKGN